MTKISIVVLLVAVVIACNADTVERKELTIPSLESLQKNVTQSIESLFSEQNIEKLRTEMEKTQLKATEVGNLTMKAAGEYGRKLIHILLSRRENLETN